jgi:hypothetical protein
LTVLATMERRRAHRIRVVHGGSGKPYPAVRAALAEPVWPHWRLDLKGADIVLSAALERLPDEPATTTVDVWPTELAQLERLTADHFTTTIARNADVNAVLTLTAAPSMVEVVLVGADGAPRPSKTVEARPKGNGSPAVPLPAASSGSNVYRSAPFTWNPAHAPYAIHVGGTKRGVVTPDHTRAITRIRVIDP